MKRTDIRGGGNKKRDRDIEREKVNERQGEEGRKRDTYIEQDRGREGVRQRK